MPNLQDFLSIGSGGLVGFTLGLVGGGGSILALPLLIYVVGVSSPHIAIGTSAIAVATSAAISLAGHARAQTVKWPCALIFALSGIVGATAGAQIGKFTNGQHLLILFGGLMVIVGLFMLSPRASPGNSDVRLDRESMSRLLPTLIGTGFVVGGLSGFFGIGGGFLIVPGLMGATTMPLLYAVGSSLVSVTAFGLTTALSYSLSGLVDWRLAAFFVLGGALGGLCGIRLGRHLSAYKRALSITFAGVVIVVGLYVTASALT